MHITARFDDLYYRLIVMKWFHFLAGYDINNCQWGQTKEPGVSFQDWVSLWGRQWQWRWLEPCRPVLEEAGISYLCTWDSTRWRRHVWHRRSWPAMLERHSGGWRSRKGRRAGKVKRLGGRRWGQALADGGLSGIGRRCWLDVMCVLREKARGVRRGGWLCGRGWMRRSRGVLKRLKERHPPSSRWVLVDLGVSWESQRMFS